jgi:hypothetical protein
MTGGVLFTAVVAVASILTLVLHRCFTAHRRLSGWLRSEACPIAQRPSSGRRFIHAPSPNLGATNQCLGRSRRSCVSVS